MKIQSPLILLFFSKLPFARSQEPPSTSGSPVGEKVSKAPEWIREKAPDPAKAAERLAAGEVDCVLWEKRWTQAPW